MLYLWRLIKVVSKFPFVPLIPENGHFWQKCPPKMMEFGYFGKANSTTLNSNSLQFHLVKLEPQACPASVAPLAMFWSWGHFEKMPTSGQVKSPTANFAWVTFTFLGNIPDCWGGAKLSFLASFVFRWKRFQSKNNNLFTPLSFSLRNTWIFLHTLKPCVKWSLNDVTSRVPLWQSTSG